MQEKVMVNDVLSMINSSLTGYANVIAQCADPNLRQTITQIRNADEQFQYQLYKVAEQKGFTNLQSRPVLRRFSRFKRFLCNKLSKQNLKNKTFPVVKGRFLYLDNQVIQLERVMGIEPT
jgi:hypothetical protein